MAYMKRAKLSPATKIAIGVSVGFSIFWLMSHPRSKLHRSLPQKKVKNLKLLPHVEIVSGNKTYHFHHWAIFSTLYYRYFLKKKLFSSKFLHGVMLGSILQGLTYKDRFKFSYKNTPASDGEL